MPNSNLLKPAQLDKWYSKDVADLFRGQHAPAVYGPGNDVFYDCYQYMADNTSAGSTGHAPSHYAPELPGMQQRPALPEDGAKAFTANLAKKHGNAEAFSKKKPTKPGADESGDGKENEEAEGEEEWEEEEWQEDYEEEWPQETDALEDACQDLSHESHSFIIGGIFLHPPQLKSAQINSNKTTTQPHLYTIYILSCVYKLYNNTM